MTIAELTEKMIRFADGDLHDISHFMKVWAYARTIGELEGLEEETQFILETAALTHDIACPLCRKKYGHADGRLQEKEGGPLVRTFLSDTGLTPAQIDRVAYLVGHHHTLEGIEGADYQILVEADLIVNAEENRWSREHIQGLLDRVVKTNAGKRIMETVFREA